MAFYHTLGKMPAKPHTTFYKDDGKSLYREELFSTRGFSGIFSNKYHIQMPTKRLAVKELPSPTGVEWNDAPLDYYHFFTDDLTKTGSFITARQEFLFNDHCRIATARVTEDTEDFYRNGAADEYVFIHRGSGTFHSEYGSMPFVAGDQLIIPAGTTYQLNFDDFDQAKLLICESVAPFRIPAHFHNEFGQLLEGAPYCERDIKIPQELETIDQTGEFRLLIKKGVRLFEITLPYHPFDVVGWDGFLYPFALNIKDYCPKVGRIHLPPPTHLAFDTEHFVLCDFVARPFDFDPNAIPAPYFHSNIHSDEVLYYVEGDFMSRKGVKEGSITLHPGGLPHGPQPGKTEESIGKKETKEYAVMIDTFAPLKLSTAVKDVLDANYPRSWLENDR